jgi:glutamyl-tRNA reductase
VARDADGLPGIHLLDLDDLQRRCCPGAGTASESLAGAHRIIEEELQRLELSLQHQKVTPQLAELHRLGSELAQQEAAWALNQLESLSETEREVVREMADRLVRRVLYPVSRNLREHARRQSMSQSD